MALLVFDRARQPADGEVPERTVFEDLGAALRVGTELLWIRTVAVGAAAYWLLHRAFARSELPPLVRQGSA